MILPEVEFVEDEDLLEGGFTFSIGPVPTSITFPRMGSGEVEAELERRSGGQVHFAYTPAGMVVSASLSTLKAVAEAFHAMDRERWGQHRLRTVAARDTRGRPTPERY